MLAGVFFVAGLASLALPGDRRFVSEFLVLIGTFTATSRCRGHRHRRHHPGRALHPADVPAHDAGPPRRRAHEAMPRPRRRARSLGGRPADRADRSPSAVYPKPVLDRHQPGRRHADHRTITRGRRPAAALHLIEPAVQRQPVSDLDGVPTDTPGAVDRLRRADPDADRVRRRVLGVLVEAFVPRGAPAPSRSRSPLVGLVGALVAAILLGAARTTVTAGDALAVDGPTLFLQGTIAGARRRWRPAARRAGARPGAVAFVARPPSRPAARATAAGSLASGCRPRSSRWPCSPSAA